MENSLWPVLDDLRSKTFVDLTHAFGPGIPHATDFEDEDRQTLFDYPEDGFLAHRYCHVGQWGTHVDPPAHFVEGKRYIDDIPVSEMILPLVVLDITSQVTTDADYALAREDVIRWETANERVPNGAFVALKSGWSKRWPDPEKMRNSDQHGIAHFPGWSVDAVHFLSEERNITAIGHETTDTDPGILVSKDEFPAETYILQQDKFQIEMLAGMDGIPPVGAIAVVTFPKPHKGSGYPARVFAILPD